MTEAEIFEKYIPDLQANLSEFKYGIMIQKKLFSAKRYDEFRYWKSLTPKEFLEYKTGLCWDFTAYEDYIFKTFFPMVKYKLFYIEGGSLPADTHTFLVYWNKNNRPVLFESILNGCKGLFEFKTEKDLLFFMGKKFFQYNPKAEYFILEYKQPDEYGLSAPEFMEHVVSTGKLRVQKGKYYEEAR